MDCSKLTQLAVHKGTGRWIPDHPAKQMNYGRWVTNPRKGDLLFWAENRRHPNWATHVGVANGIGLWTIHASAYAGFVTKTNGLAIRGYLGAKRFT